MFNYKRRQSSECKIYSHSTLSPILTIGGNNPIRVQSMTTTNTLDTEASVAQAVRIIKAGGELVRLTTQGRREAENMLNIRNGLDALGFDTPLVADVHFNANVADVAARNIEKVRINPGNYVDPARTFKKLEYTDQEYAEELKKIEERLLPLIAICKEHKTALRIGVNHGSLSDRIMSRYGDTPEGIVESCMEFLRILKREHFDDVVISIKASNTVVMVLSVRLLVSQMEKEDMHYPLHLGVTEAGEGEDGRIKSAVGIGALLSDGIGDTIRVSLSEDPEEEIPVARSIVDYISKRNNHIFIPGDEAPDFNWLRPQRRPTTPVSIIGGAQPPVVIATQPSSLQDENCCPVGGDISSRSVTSPDFIYCPQGLPQKRQEGITYLLDFNKYNGEEGTAPIFPHNAMPFISAIKSDIKFLVLPFGAPSEEYMACLRHHPEVVVVSLSTGVNRVGEHRALIHELWREGLTNPVLIAMVADPSQPLPAAIDMGALMVDGLVDGLWILNSQTTGSVSADATDLAFSILQAGRLRMTKTEYISCPGCGRTLYDLRTTIARIKEATKDLKGLKIGIMGCIVNGPGEMADADYGYVGAGPGRVSLYRQKECVEKNIPEAEAVDRLLALIKADKEGK